MGLVLFIIGLSLSVISYALLIIFGVKFVRTKLLNNEKPSINLKLFITFLSLTILMGLFTILSNYGLVMKDNMPLTIGENFLMVIGSFLFGGSIGTLTISFILYYYRPDLNKKQRFIARIITFVSIPLIIAGIWMFTDAFAPYLTYPLINGISIPNGFTTPNSGVGKFTIKWYGIIIVCGAAVSYFISDHYFYKEFQKHGILDTLLLVAFPAGIIGARLWYVIVLEPSTNFWNFQNGGLAIQGGALLGIIAGVTFMLIFRKYVNVRWAMDVIIPTILIAQAIGRWGNFFNHEVYGLETDASLWWFLPKIVSNNMYVTTSDPTKIYVPLFLIESITNLIGYFVIRYAIGKPLKKFLSNGDLSMCYLIWYGLTRVLLEPLRYGYTKGEHETGFGYNQSYITAFIFIGMGFLGIIAFHIYDYFKTQYQEKPSYFIYKTFAKNERKPIQEAYKTNLLKFNFENVSKEERKILEAICLYQTLKAVKKDELNNYLEEYFDKYYNYHYMYYYARYRKTYNEKKDLNYIYKFGKNNNFEIAEIKDNKNLIISIKNVYQNICKEYSANDLIPYFASAFKSILNREYIEINFGNNIDISFKDYNNA